MSLVEPEVMSQEVTSLQRQAENFVAQVGATPITDATTYESAGLLVRDIVRYIKRVDEVMSPIVRAANEAHRVAVRQRDLLLRPAEGAKRILGERMAAWELEQSRLRRQAEEAAQRERERQEAEARRAAETEQKRLQLQAEAQRIAEAIRLEERGDQAAADRLMAEPIPVPTVVPAPVFDPQPIAPAAPKLDGVSYSDVWDFQIENEALIPREYLMVDDKKIRAVVKALKGATRIPGIKAVPRRNASVRA